LDHLPPHLHLIIITRADPPLPLTRLRTRGELTELRAADLRFSATESAAFLTNVMGLALTGEEVAALEVRTEGWIAGLQLAALAMRDRADRSGFIAAFTGSHRFVVDYLAEEVLDRLPRQLQTFVLQTSVLERMCGPLCDALLTAESVGQVHSQVVLEELERANLFMVPLDDERRWYRYHHLFAEVLRARLQSRVSSADVATLHLRASTWYERQSLINEAIEHAILARDFERVARLTNEHSERVWMHGGLATLLQWLSVLPAAAIEAHPRLALHHALILAVTDHSQLAEQRIAAAERALQTAPVRDVGLLGRAQVLRSGIALLTDLPADVTIATGARALELLPEWDHFWRGFAGLFLGLGYYVQAGNLVAAYRILTEAEQAGSRAGDAVCASSAFSHRSVVLELSGRLRESEHVNRIYLKQASEPAWQGVPLAAYARLGLGRVLYERNELAAAREQILEAIQQLEAWALKRPLIGAYLTLSRLHQALGEATLARDVMERAVTIVQKAALKQTFSPWASFRMRMAVMQGDMTAVAEWVQEIEPSTHGDLDPALEFKHITLARIYLTQRRLDAAQQLLDRLLPSAHAAGRMGQVLDIYLLQAQTLYAQGRETEAFAALERALLLAEPEGYVRTFVDQGAPMAALLTQVARGDTPVAAYAASLLDAFPMTEPRERLHSAHGPQPSALIEPLSARELEILRLIADGQSNQAIADTLIVAVSTVKKHINNIYGKLEVQSRTQALLRARQLKVL
jgi:LuxR family maltose regulon positive regulatory protein